MTDITATSTIRNAVPWGGMTCLAIEPVTSYGGSDYILIADSNGVPIYGIATILGAFGLKTGAAAAEIDFSNTTHRVTLATTGCTLVLVWGK